MNPYRELTKIPEIAIQRAVRRLMMSSDMPWTTTRGASVQFLTAGEWNRFQGPDFLNVALLHQGEVFVGSAEFHRSSSDWIAHGHSAEGVWADLLVHLVLVDDCHLDVARHTIVLPSDKVLAALHKMPEPSQHGTTTDIFVLEDLQEYALSRLERKSSYARKLLHTRDKAEVLRVLAEEFFESRSGSRSRPRGYSTHSADLAKAIAGSVTMEWLHRAESEDFESVMSAVRALYGLSLASESKALRTEIFANIFLPVLLAIARAELRNAVASWFWTIPSAQQYGKLSRAFPHLPQQWLWQQQGMLEYLRDWRASRTAEPSVPWNASSDTYSLEIRIVGKGRIGGA